MFEELNKLKEKVKNLYNGNIEIIKDEIDTFICTYVINEEKRKKYLNELNYISFSGSFEMEDEFINPGGIERNKISENRGFNNGKKELFDLLLKIEVFLQSNINKEKENENLIQIGVNFQDGLEKKKNNIIMNPWTITIGGGFILWLLIYLISEFLK